MVATNQIAGFALAISVAVVVMMLGLSIADQAIGQSTGIQSVDNESITAAYDEPVELDAYDLQSGTVEVYNASGALVPSGEYTVNEGPATINVSSSSTSIADGETISVTYDYEAADSLTTFIVGFIPVMMGVLAFVVVARPVTRMS